MVMVSINHHHIILSKFETAFGANFGETFSREREEQLKFENAAYFEKAHRFAEYKTQTNKNSKKRETNNVTRFVKLLYQLRYFYATGQTVIVVNGQRLNSKIAIWSHWKLNETRAERAKEKKPTDDLHPV